MQIENLKMAILLRRLEKQMFEDQMKGAYQNLKRRRGRKALDVIALFESNQPFKDDRVAVKTFTD